MEVLNPFEIQELSKQGRTGLVFAILTTQTCGEPCWHAREEICRCSCGGRNHGCLRTAEGVRPERTAKIDGERYRLAGVGEYRSLIADAARINKAAGWKAIEKPIAYGDGGWMQYKYHWRETDCGAPARLKPASKDQVARWEELTAWRDSRSGIYLLWERITMPERPTEKVIDCETGLPLENQNP